jgi:ketosteroid isomerase-like protein
MAALYATDGVLVSPGGPLIRGRAALQAYYKNRFASGARDHESKVAEAHAMGEGGYGLGTFSVNTPQSDGNAKRLTGNIAYVCKHGPDGWRLQAVVPSVPPPN